MLINHEKRIWTLPLTGIQMPQDGAEGGIILSKKKEGLEECTYNCKQKGQYPQVVLFWIKGHLSVYTFPSLSFSTPCTAAPPQIVNAKNMVPFLHAHIIICYVWLLVITAQLQKCNHLRVYFCMYAAQSSTEWSGSQLPSNCLLYYHILISSKP